MGCFGPARSDGVRFLSSNTPRLNPPNLLPAGKDAFHRVPSFGRDEWDGVESVPTRFAPVRTRSTASPALVRMNGTEWNPSLPGLGRAGNDVLAFNDTANGH